MSEPALKRNSHVELVPETKQQRASHPAASVWVNASAGSGKTTVLTHRVMRLLLDGVKPHKILCLTYTRAAAAEMAIRITDKLSIWATCSENELSASISDLQGYPPTSEQMNEARRLFARILACPGGMRIRTIHAFCQEILRRFPLESGLPPHFAVIEEAEARALQDEVQRELLNLASEDPASALGQALKCLVLNVGEYGFGDALKSVLQERPRLQAALAKAGGAVELIAQMRGYLQLDATDNVASLCREAAQDTAMAKTDLLQAATWLQEGSKRYAPRGQQMRAWLNAAVDERIAKFEDYCGCFFTEKGDPYKEFANKDLLAKYPPLAAILDREVMRLQLVRERLETAQLAETTSAIITFGAAFLQRLEARKAEKAILDYDDLIIRTDALLRRPGIAPWILFKLDGGLDHLLVDEAQDTSRAQWNIVSALVEEFFAGSTARSNNNRTLFVVGDEKQSIFSFQRADPEAFLAMRGDFAQRITNAEKPYYEVPMRTSYRSAPAILKAVDTVFAAAHVVSGVSTEPVEHMPALPRAGEAQKIGRVEVWPLQPAPPKDKAQSELWEAPIGYEKEHDPQAELAQQIATKIKTNLDVGTWDAGDIMILLRRRGRFADLMVRALKERNVPVTGVDRMHLVKQLPVMDLLALLQFTLLPEDDLNLASVLRGPLLNLSEDHLMQLAIKREGTLWQSLISYQNKPVFAAVHEYLLRWLNASDFITPFALLANILNETCPGSKISGKHALWARLGPDAIDPIEELLSAAQNFSRNHAPSLQNFLHWLMATEAEIKRELDRSGGQVRIMTVHASKGLEAPIVFLPDSASVPRVQDMPKFLWSKDDVPLFTPRRPGNAAARGLWEAGRQRQVEEYRRLLYVALTRAAKELYIVGWEAARKEPNSEESWYNLALEGLKDLHEPAAMQQSLTDSSPLAGEARRGGAQQSEYLDEGMAPSPNPSREGRGTPPLFPQPLICFSDPDLSPDKKTKAAKTEKPAPKKLPDWVRQSPEAEAVILHSVPSQPTLATATPDSVFARGRIIHRLLQSLPSVEATKRQEVAARFLANPQHQLTNAQQQEIQKEVLDLLGSPDYAPLFGPDSQAEVPMAGTVKGRAMSGQVDRLCHVGKEIWIVDYKTNRPPPQNLEGVPEIYRQQLADYRLLLQEIYPGKAIRCFLLWTYKLSLMELPAAYLAT